MSLQFLFNCEWILLLVGESCSIITNLFLVKIGLPCHSSRSFYFHPAAAIHLTDQPGMELARCGNWGLGTLHWPCLYLNTYHHSSVLHWLGDVLSCFNWNATDPNIIAILSILCMWDIMIVTKYAGSKYLLYFYNIWHGNMQSMGKLFDEITNY